MAIRCMRRYALDIDIYVCMCVFIYNIIYVYIDKGGLLVDESRSVLSICRSK